MKKIDVNEMKGRGDFAIILKCLLMKNRVKQCDLATQTGISSATISNYIKGKSFPTSKNISLIADFLGISPKTFFEGSEKYIEDNDLNKNVFQKNIAHLIREKGILQNDLAKAINVSRQTINYYVNGKQYPTDEVMEKIAEYFSTSVEALKHPNSNIGYQYQIGDEVITSNGNKGVITAINDDSFAVMSNKGTMYGYLPKERWQKTGKHYEIETILNELKEETK